MTTQVQPISEVTQRATNALIRELGVVDTIRSLPAKESEARAGSPR